MSDLVWRTIRQGKKWRDKTGQFIIESRTGGDYGPGTVYLLLHPLYDTDGFISHWHGQYDTLDEAKAAAEERAA